MPLTMSDLSVPAFVIGLEALDGVLAKAERHAAEKKIGEAAFLEARLFPDMLPLASQVRIACDTARRGLARLAGIEPGSVPDEEKSFAELRARIASTLAFVRAVPVAVLDGAEDKPIRMETRDRVLAFQSKDFLLTFALPNFYFHLATAYGLLRHGGVEVGKRDFLGAVRVS